MSIVYLPNLKYIVHQIFLATGTEAYLRIPRGASKSVFGSLQPVMKTINRFACSGPSSLNHR